MEIIVVLIYFVFSCKYDAYIFHHVFDSMSDGCYCFCLGESKKSKGMSYKSAVIVTNVSSSLMSLLDIDFLMI